jgi:site-specific recombinase XerD
MFLHKRSNGFYYVHFRNESGRWQSVSTKSNVKTEANKFFSDLKRNLHKKPVSIPFSTFKDQYLTYSKTNHSPGSTTRLTYVLQHFVEFIADPQLDKINTQTIEAYKAHRLGTISPCVVSPVTVNIELRTLKALFSQAVKWGALERNPFDNLKLIRLPEQTPVHISPIDVKTLLNAITTRWLRDIILFALNTGMRRGELINMRWDDLDFNRSTVMVKNSETFKTKSRTERGIPLNPQALNILKELPKRSEYVFTNSDGNKLIGKYVSECFRQAVKDSGLNPQLHFHSLRHSFATFLVKDGVSLYEVQKLLGHSNISVTQVYSHLQPETLHNTVNKISLQLN